MSIQMRALDISGISALMFLVGCGVVAKVQTRNDMMESKAEYTNCLKQQADDPSKCENLKRIYQANLAAYNATAAGIKQGGVVQVQQGQ